MPKKYDIQEESTPPEQTTPEQLALYADHMLADSEHRLQYQHEYTIAGLKTLVWINGGAIIGLLTYAGNASDKIAAGQFRSAFIYYVLGLAAATFAYFTAYLSQAFFMLFSHIEGIRSNGMEPSNKTDREVYMRRGNRAVGTGTVLAIGALCLFVAGSISAANAISSNAPPEVPATPKSELRSSKDTNVR